MSTQQSGRVELQITDAIASVTFNRPDALNAMTWSMYEELKVICKQLHENPVSVIQFRGAGRKSFVCGTDISQFKNFKDGNDGLAYERLIDEHIALIESIPSPTIAIIDELAVGGGLAIAAACDFRIATHTARIGAPIAKTVGNCLSSANIARLVSHLGVAQTKRILMLAELIPVSELTASGFILRTASSEELDGIAHELVQQLLVLGPLTIKTSKLEISRFLQANIPNCDDLIQACYGSADFKEAVNAFTEKRKPRWQGR